MMSVYLVNKVEGKYVTIKYKEYTNHLNILGHMMLGYNNREPSIPKKFHWLMMFQIGIKIK